MLNLRKLPEIPVRLMTVATINYNHLTKYFNEVQCKVNSVLYIKRNYSCLYTLHGGIIFFILERKGHQPACVSIYKCRYQDTGTEGLKIVRRYGARMINLHLFEVNRVYCT